MELNGKKNNLQLPRRCTIVTFHFVITNCGFLFFEKWCGENGSTNNGNWEGRRGSWLWACILHHFLLSRSYVFLHEKITSIIYGSIAKSFMKRGENRSYNFLARKKLNRKNFTFQVWVAHHFSLETIFSKVIYIFIFFFFVYFILLSSFPEALNTTKWWRSIKWEKVNYKNYSIWRFRRTQNEAEIEENDNFALVLMCNIVWKIFYTVLEVKA